MTLHDISIDDAISYVNPNLSVEQFVQECLLMRWRKGQCWYNALTAEDKGLLVESVWDPFHSYKWIDILMACCFLLDNNVSRFELVKEAANKGYFVREETNKGYLVRKIN